MITNFTVGDLYINQSLKDKLFSMIDPKFPVLLEKNIIISRILKYMSGLRKELIIIAEDKYIDKVYRNSFSNYYSTKLNDYPEYCVRLSFLEPNTNFDYKEDILKKYLGFMILRPILPGVVGRTIINPKAFIIGNDIVICKAKFRTSVLGYKSSVRAFPHSSQDSEYSTCAETSIWSIMDYFGNKYPEYSPILPSKIHEILDKKAHERHVPSHGLTYFDISYVLKMSGFGTKNYNRNRDYKDSSKDKKAYDDFKIIFNTYIESGIPIGVAITSESSVPFGHAVVCIGRKKIDRNEISKTSCHTKNGQTYKRWSEVPQDFIFNDDNVGAYQMTDFNNPAPQHGRKDLFISNIIVPLYNKIYLDAPSAIKLSENYCTEFLPFSKPIILRTFLASSNTYLDHLISDKGIEPIYKNLILNHIRFPKFIWVTEISEEDKFIHKEVEGLIILDATEPFKNGIVFPLLGVNQREIHFYDAETKVYRKNLLPLPFQLASFNNLD